jgi:hypothetical protein
MGRRPKPFTNTAVQPIVAANPKQTFTRQAGFGSRADTRRRESAGDGDASGLKNSVSDDKLSLTEDPYREFCLGTITDKERPI